MRDLRGGQTAHGAQCQRDLRGGGQRRMTAQEQQRERVVAATEVVDLGARGNELLRRCEGGGVLLAPATGGLATQQVGQPQQCRQGAL